VAFALGCAAWLASYLVMPPPFRAYVLAHELTHALWGILFGARVSRLRVGQDSGSVTLTRTNFLILLAPYFFPAYALLILAAYGVASIFADLDRYRPLMLAAAGFAWMLHLTFTAASMNRRQTDIARCGLFFSSVFVALVNVLVVCLCLVAVTRATLEHFLGMWWLRLLAQAALARRAWEYAGGFLQ
jgi:hypothetical protein